MLEAVNKNCYQPSFGSYPYRKRSVVKEYATVAASGALAGAAITTLLEIVPNRAHITAKEGLARVAKQAGLWAATLLIFHAACDVVRKIMD